MRDFASRRTCLLEMTQLTPFADRLAGQLSGGMKQKLALACTLIHEPRLIVLDEADHGVDPVSRREFWKLLEFLSQRITIVMSTPYLDEAERCSVALLHKGESAGARHARRATSQPSGLALRGAHHRSPQGRHCAARHAWRCRRRPLAERAHVRLTDSQPDAAPQLSARLESAGVGVTMVRQVSASLEDVFVKSIGRQRSMSTFSRRPHLRALFGAFVLLLAAGRAHARGAAPGLTLSLADAIDRALAASHRIAEARARGDVAAASVGERRASTMPQVNAAAAYIMDEPRRRVRHPAAQQTSCASSIPIFQNNTRALDVQWPVYTAGRLNALVTRATRRERDRKDADNGCRRAPRYGARSGILPSHRSR